MKADESYVLAQNEIIKNMNTNVESVVLKETKPNGDTVHTWTFTNDNTYDMLVKGGVDSFLGEYSTLQALKTAHPTSTTTRFAFINNLSTGVVSMATWDNTSNDWQTTKLNQAIPIGTSGQSIGFSGTTEARLNLLTNDDWNNKEFLYYDTDMHCLLLYKPTVLQFLQYDGQVVGTIPSTITPTEGQIWIGTERIYTWDNTNKYWKIKLYEYIRKHEPVQGGYSVHTLNGAELRVHRDNSDSMWISVYQNTGTDTILYSLDDSAPTQIILVQEQEQILVPPNISKGTEHLLATELVLDGNGQSISFVRYENTIFVLQSSKMLTSSVMVGATTSTDGTIGIPPKPVAGQQNHFYKGNGTWAQPSKSDIGLGNLTNDAQVKKIASSTDNNLMSWNGTTGDTPKDSGIPSNKVITTDGSQTLSNKTLDSSNIFYNVIPKDNNTYTLGSLPKCYNKEYVNYIYGGNGLYLGDRDNSVIKISYDTDISKGYILPFSNVQLGTSVSPFVAAYANSIIASGVNLKIAGGSDVTRSVSIDTSLITSGTNRTLQAPNKDGTIATTADIPVVSDHASSGYMDIGTMRIQWGQGSGGATDYTTVYLPNAFAYTNYIVTGTIIGNGDATFSITVVNQATTWFQVRKRFANNGVWGGATTESFNWMAIGVRP